MHHAASIFVEGATMGSPSPCLCLALHAALQHRRMSVHTRCVASPMARKLRALACPLSAIQDLPRVVSAACCMG
jgi:hypothetical protein